MLQSPVKSVIARSAILALVLALAISFFTVGLAPSASAQTAEDDPCTMEEGTSNVACSFDENSDDVAADFSAMDPEGEGIDWAVEGLDAADFEINGGVLTFKESPNYESPTDRVRLEVQENLGATPPVMGVTAEDADNNVYLVTVRATELLAADQDPPALHSVLYVTVTVDDVEEAGKITLNRLQPEVDAELTATLSDPDRGEGNDQAPQAPSWTWSIPKVNRPDITNDNHWQAAAGSATPALQQR